MAHKKLLQPSSLMELSKKIVEQEHKGSPVGGYKNVIVKRVFSFFHSKIVLSCGMHMLAHTTCYTRTYVLLCTYLRVMKLYW